MSVKKKKQKQTKTPQLTMLRFLRKKWSFVSPVDLNYNSQPALDEHLILVGGPECVGELKSGG